MSETTTVDHQYFLDLDELASKFPVTSADMLMDIRMVNEANASCRLVRMNRQPSLHFHESSDENVYVFSGKALFQLGNEKRVIGKQAFVQFPKRHPARSSGDYRGASSDSDRRHALPA